MKTPNNEATYEEQFNPLVRRVERLRRALRASPRTILIELRWRLGDEIMALPTVDALRARYPRARLHVWTHYPELFVDRETVDTVNQPLSRVDRYVLLHSAHRDVFRSDDYGARAGIEPSPSRPRFALCDEPLPLPDALSGGSGPLVALAPGATWSTKHWPADRWRALADSLVRRGARVVELGGEDDATGIMPTFAGKTSVGDAARILRHADLAITHDSGLMHLARAVDTPVVALFGPTVPEILIRDDEDFCAIETHRDCAGCWNRSQEMEYPGTCPRVISGCMDTISVDEVIAAAEDLVLGSWKQCVSFF